MSNSSLSLVDIVLATKIANTRLTASQSVGGRRSLDTSKSWHEGKNKFAAHIFRKTDFNRKYLVDTFNSIYHNLTIEIAVVISTSVYI